MTEVTHTYLLWHADTAGNPVPFYVGESLDPIDRYKDHVRAFNKGDKKEAYDYLRKHSIASFDYESVPDKTEAELVTELTLAGFTLYNANRGRAKATKTNGWKRANDEALKRLDDAANRRVRLHNAAQQLTKSELVRQRITNDLPTLEQLQAATWIECPGLLLGLRGASAERAEYTKFGDVSIFVAYRRDDRESSAVVRHRDGSELNIESGFSRTTRDQWLAYIARHWNTPEMLWKAKRAE